MTLSLIALGSNLGNRRDHMRHALTRLGALPSTTLRSVSALYETAPVGGPEDQHAYFNAAALIETDLDARRLLEAVQTIEAERQRQRLIRWGPRTLDLDILTFGDVISDDSDLTLPHPRMHERRFVMVPVCDIAPGHIHPRLGRTMADLLASLPVEAGDLNSIDPDWADPAMPMTGNPR